MNILPIRKPFKTKYGTWAYEINRKRLSLHTKDKSEALRLFNEIKRQYLAGKLVQLTGGCSKSLSDFAVEYLEWAQDAQNKSTFRANRLALTKVLEICEPTTTLDKLGLKQIDLILAASTVAKLSRSSINNYIRHIRAVFNKAVDWGYISANPFRHARELPKQNRQPAFLSRDEITKLVASIKDLDLRRLVVAYLATGRRRGELLTLEWGDIDWEARRYLVRISKTHLSRWYPINEQFAAVLKAMPEGEGRVFGRWQHPDTISHNIKAALRDVGLGHIRTHDLRHTFAHLVLDSGGAMRELQELLGHTELRTTEIYAHVSNDRLARVANAVRLGPVDLSGK